MIKPALADRERIQEHQERLPREDLLEGLPGAAVLLRVRGLDLQHLAAHGFPAESWR
jgi:hypothetical protein